MASQQKPGSSTQDGQSSTVPSSKFVPKSFRCLEIYSVLLRAELAIQTRNGEERKSMCDVVQFLTTCSDLSTADISKLVDDFTESKHLVRALVLLRAECDLRPPLNPPESALWLEERTTKIYKITRALIDEKSQRKREIAVEYGINKIEDLLSDFRQIKGVLPCIRANMEMSCLNDLAHLYDNIGELKVSRRLSQEALKIIEKKIKGSRLKNLFYGYVLHNIGTSFAKDGDVNKAESYFVRALEAYKKASSSASFTKQHWVELCEANLKKVRDYKRRPKSASCDETIV